MMPAAKHGDPQMGIDIHLCVVPASPSPVPLPTPHISIVFDPFDYLPILGTTVTISGMKCATAGTGAIVIHIPPGFPFAPTPKLPDKEDELFMGSSTVIADDEPLSHIAHPVLGCQVVGMISPPRLKKRNMGIGLLPTTFNLAIPTNVFVGGPPTISMMGMAMKGLFAGLGKFARSGAFKRFRQRLFKNLDPGFLKCTVLRAEPVNILSGEVSVEHEDFTLPGRIPIEWRRTYSSGTQHTGWCGFGWETLADIRLEVDRGNGTVSMIRPDGGPLFFDQLPLSRANGEENSQLELMDGALLSDHGKEFQIRTKEDRIYHFDKAMVVDGESVIAYPLKRISDLCGNWLEFQYANNQLIGIAESAGRYIELVTEDDRITEIALHMLATEERHVFVRYQYDQAGDLAAAIDTLGNPYRFVYDSHHMVRHTDRNGLSFYYEYEKLADEEWRVIHAWGDGNLYNYRFEYFDPIQERRITNSLGHVFIVKLNEVGLPISEIDPLDGMTIFEYDDCGRTTAVIDPSGYKTAYEYDQSGNLLKLTRPDSKNIEIQFNTANKSTAMIDPNGAKWLQQWDTRGLLIEQTTPLGNTTHYEYDQYGQLIAFINPRGARTELEFDSVGNLTVLKDALGHRTCFAYDHLGNIIGKLNQLKHKILYRYDAKNRLIAAQLPSNASIQYGYDPEDNLTRYVDENGAETRFEYFGLSEIKRRIQSDGHSVQYHYDTEERLIGVTNQRGEIYKLVRDALGRIVEEIDYWEQSRRYTYNSSSYLTSATDPLGRTIQYTTDQLGRILQKIYPDGQAETFVYDPNGNLIQTGNTHGVLMRQFDAESRLVEEKQGDFTLYNSYDSTGNRIARQSSTGNTIAYEYDLLSQVTATYINQDAPIQIKHNAAGQIVREALNPKLSRMYRYNADGYLTEQAVTNNGSTLFAASYNYDAVGNLIERRDSQYGIDRYRYDPLGRITEYLDPQQRFTYYSNDPAGDRLRTKIVQGKRERVAGGDIIETEWHREGVYEDTYYSFDRAGNLEELRNNKQRLHLVWDANQRLTESHANHTITRYGYDPLGRRMFKETGNYRTKFFWDGDVLIGDTVVELTLPTTPETVRSSHAISFDERREALSAAAGRNKIREFVYYLGTFKPLAMLIQAENSWKTYYYHNDPNGCPMRLTSSQGELKWAASYTAWGSIAKLHVNMVDNPIRLQGQYEDAETSFTCSRYRYFDSKNGSFLSMDPIGLAGGLLPYQYAPNSLGWVDPLGLACGPAVKQNSRGQWIDARGRFAIAPDVSNLPRLKGRSVHQIAAILRSRGYTRTNPHNSINQRWVHPDGSEVQIHAYGGGTTGPYKSSNNAHVHKSLGRHGRRGSTELADDGMTSVGTYTEEAHIGIRNPKDFPIIRGRPHGT
ncbi:DUF6531 domain-containing protein [Nitrosomonas communis]|uniref:RHS repeat-associated core domain-containing protein n=1 Tax=Nitrosomonas communis TaxID=44574 RepID=A0A1H2V3G8_9PROT|nr:DUF6531 domain-containing protein [Nitrosomonas communis]SDW62886.1 RHS repeat-associated core domain-containing protein [Nitrosomonas communis]